MCQRPHQPRRVRAFTLLEVLIVILILGVLAGIVIAQFSATPEATRANAARSTMQTIRAQIELYKYHHGLPESPEVLFLEGYIANMPNPPEGFLYQYDPVTGAFWVECTPGNTSCPEDIDTW